MKIIFTLIFITIAVSLISCRNSAEIPVGFNSFKQLANIQNGTRIYVIPGSGCTGCISNVEQMALNSQQSKKDYFIFTRLKSMKLFRNRFGAAFMNSSNIVLDTTNLIIYPDVKFEIYPMVFTKRKEKIIFDSYLKP